jgi:uncharacterized protein YgbK (DUF1537 family)
MAVLLILADDLTGALDTGVQFAKRGISVRVFVSPQSAALNDTAGEASVLVINTGTRHCSPAEAKAVIAKCLKAFAAVPHVYKKTDSTLRGNIGAELEALAEGPQKIIPFIPAYPDLGRTTKGGHHFVNGVPLNKTESAADALNPVQNSFIPGIIAEETSIPVHLIPLVNGTMKHSDISGPVSARGIMVFDCETNEDMRNIAAALKEAGLLHATAGCAGFAGALMEKLPFPIEDTTTGKNNAAAKTGRKTPVPILFISGSRHPASVTQIKAALERGAGGIALPGEKLLSRKWLAGREAENLVKDCTEQLSKKGIFILGTASSFGLEDGSISGGDENNIAKGLGYLAKRISKIRQLHLAVFGGDTFCSVMEALGPDYIVPEGEIRPGIVHAKAGNLSIAAKSGAFGGPDIIEIITGYFQALP